MTGEKRNRFVLLSSDVEEVNGLCVTKSLLLFRMSAKVDSESRQYQFPQDMKKHFT